MLSLYNSKRLYLMSVCVVYFSIANTRIHLNLISHKNGPSLLHIRHPSLVQGQYAATAEPAQQKRSRVHAHSC
jgi:hypothetical protein